MRRLPWCLALLLAASTLSAQAASAKKSAPANPVAQTPAPAEPKPQAPADFADAFHEALHARDQEKILSMLAPGLVVFETGYLEATREEYVKDSLSDDANFASATEYRPLSRGVIGSGDYMTVLTKASIKGTYANQTVDLLQSETMILRRTLTSWQIVHLHWSAHPRSAEPVEARAPSAPVAPVAPVAPEPPQLEPEAPTAPPPSTEATTPPVTEATPQDAKTP
ncbi:MAG: hypothetical protein E6Q40_12270 [Cupriavidus sp.]|nr:MAG: hypothetical protein E6Q40_12270 [Cupriavidus sp.]